LLQVDDGGGWFVMHVSADNGVVIGRCGWSRARRRRDERVVLHADLFDSSEIPISLAASLVRVVVSTPVFSAIVAVFQRVCEGDVVVFVLWLVLVEFVGRIGVGAEEGSEEIDGGSGRSRFGGAVLLSGSQVGRWGFSMRSRHPFILWRGLSL
jgi:hypothetical protein